MLQIFLQALDVDYSNFNSIKDCYILSFLYEEHTEFAVVIDKGSMDTYKVLNRNGLACDLLEFEVYEQHNHIGHIYKAFLLCVCSYGDSEQF